MTSPDNDAPGLWDLHIDLRNKSLSFAEGSDDALSYWASLLEAELAMMARSVGNQGAVALSADLLQAAVAAHKIADDVGSVQLPSELFRDGETGFYWKTFFIADYSRYDRSDNSLIMIRSEFEEVTPPGASGQRLVQKIASAIRGAIRTVDVPCRWSKTEFVILLPRTNVKDAKLVADRINHSDQLTGLPIGALSVGITAAVPNEPFDQIVGRADWAVYSAHVSNDHEVRIG